MKFISLLFIALILFGCTSGYKKFYQPYVDARTLPDVELIQPGQEPKVFGTDNFERDIRLLRAKRYIVIGYSSFNGRYEDTKNAVAQAKAIGATVVLINSEYTDTQTTTSMVFVPNSQTTYHSGSFYGSAYGGYSGTSTTHSSSVVPHTTQHRRYDQEAVYLVKSTQKIIYGLFLVDLTPEQRAEIERNTGVLIDVIIEDSPAFNSNVLAGDILISIDGTNVRNVEHALEVMKNSGNSEYSILSVIRNGKEKEVKVEF